ncbi:MAG: hypothetical protein PHP85_01370 [Gallionella sp.]|nr:hypothetical protein [Gallionella sp.]
MDIVEYSKKPVTGQISLKDRFNTYLSEAIYDVPTTDRIILDTGDGAAITFLGDPESALKAALRLRASLLSEDPYLEPELLVRIGINLGPVRLVRDINGHPNIVGDGINVAQRVMGFADASQILVSRSYYDAVSRISAQYTGMFHYQGSRTDKHVREHEIYAIGYPGDQTTKRLPVNENQTPVQLTVRVRSALLLAGSRLSVLIEKVKQTGTKQRALYAGVAVVLLLAGSLMLMPHKPVENPPVLAVETMPGPVSSVVSAPVAVEVVSSVPDTAVAVSARKPLPDKSAEQAAKHKTELAAAKKAGVPVKAGEGHVASRAVVDSTKPVVEAGAVEPVQEARLIVSCKDDVQVFVDGAQKGKTSSGSLTLITRPGKHKVILTHASFGIFTDEVSVDAGKTERMKPKVCN